MTTTTDLNRWWWERGARGAGDVRWEDLGTAAPGVEEVVVDRPPGRWLLPPSPGPGAVLAIHGGGFVSGSVESHRRMFGHLALAARAPVLAVEYGLVPEHVHPSQLDTVTDAYRALLDDGVRDVAVVGDSCGAMLAVSLAVRLRDEGLPAPRALLLLSAWTDLEATGASYDAGTDPFFTRELVRGLAAGYLAGTDPRDPHASPLHAPLHGLPPTYLQVGGAEALLDDSRALADRLAAAGVDARLDVVEGQLHTFQMTAGRSAVADDAIGRGGAWLRSILTS